MMLRRLVNKQMLTGLTSVRFYSKLDFEDIEELQRTTVSVGSIDNSSSLLLSGCFKGGFKFLDKLIMGSVALVPNSVFSWNVDNVDDIDESSLSLFTIFHPKLDILIVGTGDEYQRLKPSVLDIMHKRGLMIEVQDTLHACGSYNLLKTERPGLVGAALLPLLDEKKISKVPVIKKQRSKPSII